MYVEKNTDMVNDIDYDESFFDILKKFYCAFVLL